MLQNRGVVQGQLTWPPFTLLVAMWWSMPDFGDLGYLDLSNIFWMDAQSLQACTGMPKGTAYLIQREMDECQKK